MSESRKVERREEGKFLTHGIDFALSRDRKREGLRGGKKKKPKPKGKKNKGVRGNE
jgi:hypothetical protein